jgi:hypothetical protein
MLLPVAEGRNWTSVDGRKTEGKMKSYDAASGKVTVIFPNGRRAIFAQDKLPNEDIAWLKRTVIGALGLGPSHPFGTELYEQGGKTQPGYRGTPIDLQ